MPLPLQNWKLAILALFFISLFTCLGLWQVSRATEKKHVLIAWQNRAALPPLDLATADSRTDLRFYRTTLTGEFDSKHTVLLDNKIQDGKIGYEVYTLLHIKHLPQPILVDRGFIPLGQDRRHLPALATPTGPLTLTGFLNLPPRYVSLGGNMTDSAAFPLRVEYIHLKLLSGFFGETPYPYLFILDKIQPAAYAVKPVIISMTPEKHLAYAAQWFAFALTLLILFVALNRPMKNRKTN